MGSASQTIFGREEQGSNAVDLAENSSQAASLSSILGSNTNSANTPQTDPNNYAALRAMLGMGDNDDEEEVSKENENVNTLATSSSLEMREQEALLEKTSSLNETPDDIVKTDRVLAAKINETDKLSDNTQVSRKATDPAEEFGTKVNKVEKKLEIMWRTFQL